MKIKRIVHNGKRTGIPLFLGVALLWATFIVLTPFSTLYEAWQEVRIFVRGLRRAFKHPFYLWREFRRLVNETKLDAG